MPFKAIDLHDIIEERLVDALERGNTRSNACALAGIGLVTLKRWLRLADEKKAEPRYVKLARRVLEAEARAEDEGISHIRSGATGWQGMAWWMERHPRRRKIWVKVEAPTARALPGRGANDNDLADVPLSDLEAVLQDAAELKRKEIRNKKEAK